MNGAIANVDNPGARTLKRLGVALAASIALHAWFLWGVRVVAPRKPVESGAIRARIAPAPPELPTASDTPTEVSPTTASSPAPESGASTPPDTPSAAPSPAAAVKGPPPAPAVPLPSPQVEPVERLVAPAAVPEPQSFGPALEVPQIEDPEFYPARKLDVLPRPLADVALRYPDAAAEQDVSGHVVLLLLIDELGMVVEASVISADPPGVFDAAALESFRDVMFSPAQRNGRAVKSRLPVEVTFDAKVGSMKP